MLRLTAAFLPIILCYWVLAAHFFREGSFLLVFICWFAPWFLFFEERWAARALQIGLVLGTLEWITTIVDLVAARRLEAKPYERLVLILGTVAAATLASTLLFRLPVMQRRFQLGQRPPSDASTIRPDHPPGGAV